MLTRMKDAGADGVEALVDEVVGIQDPVRQGVAVDALMETWPGKTSALCPSLPVGSTRDRCEMTNSRPHLWQVSDTDPEAGPMGAGKAYSVLTADASLVRSPWAEVIPMVARCAEGTGQDSCQVREAQNLARLGRPHEVAALCNGIQEEKWRYECYFQAAEAAFKLREVGSPGKAAELCLGSGWFLDRCLGHLAGEVANTAPAATWQVPRMWKALSMASSEVYFLLEPHGPAVADRWRGLFWADVMQVAYGNVEQLVGNPLDIVEPQAVPHVRATVAARLWALEGRRTSHTLDGWVDRLEEALAARAEDRSIGPMPLNDEKIRTSWKKDLEGEDELYWTPYLGHRSRRVVAEDARTDARVCILEALAQTPGMNREELVESALGDADPLVRWTAARIAPQVMESLNPRFLASETDSRVRGRLLGFGAH